MKEVIGSLDLDQEQLNRLQDLIIKNIPLTSFTIQQSSSSSTAVSSSSSSSSKTNQNSKEVFYTNADDNLILARKDISIYSFQKSKDRIIGTKRRRDTFSVKEEDNQFVSE